MQIININISRTIIEVCRSMLADIIGKYILQVSLVQYFIFNIEREREGDHEYILDYLIFIRL